MMVIDIHPCEMDRFNRHFSRFVEKLEASFRADGYSEAEIKRATYANHERTLESYWKDFGYRYLRSSDHYDWRRWNAEPGLSANQKRELNLLYGAIVDEVLTKMALAGQTPEEIAEWLDWWPGRIAADFWEGMHKYYVKGQVA